MHEQPESSQTSAAGPAPQRSAISDVDLGFYVDLYKQAVEVQQHFNDIQWRIRGLALTVATATIGAAGIAARDGTTIGPISLGSVVAAVGLILWNAFYYVDKEWYHPFLRSSVSAGQRMEEVLQTRLPKAGMTAAIIDGSPKAPNWRQKLLFRRPAEVQPNDSRAATNSPTGGGWRPFELAEDGLMHSDQKLTWFYTYGAAAFVLVAVALQVGVMIGPDPGATLQPPTASATTSPTP